MDLSELQRHKKQQINRHPWEIARLKVIHHLLQKHTTNIHHILDIGSGDCFVIKELQKKNISDQYTAVDHSFTPDIIQNLELGREPSIQHYSYLPSQLEEKSDCVLFLDVLEHCENDNQVLASVLNNEIVTYDAKVIITVPAFQSLFSQHDTLLGHYRRYDINQLKALVASSQLRIMEIGYFFTSLLLIRCIHWMFEKLNKRKASKGIDNWEGNRWLTQNIVTFLSFDFFISRLLLSLGIRIPGLSLYCICQR